jgi:hypothetical protein
MDSMSVSFYPYWTMKDTTDPKCKVVWAPTKPHPRYYGLTDDTLDPIGKYGLPIWNDSVITIDAVNDSIWADVIYTWSNDIGMAKPNPKLRHLRTNMGYSVWNCEDSTVSDIVTEYLVPIAGEYARILFPQQMARYAYSFNWKTAVGPLDSTQRASAESGCGIDLPKRYSEYGIPEILKICEVMGVKPNFVYTRVSDTAYCVLDTFEFSYVDTFHDTIEITIVDTAYRKSLGDDARDFAEYLFGDTATSGWAKLRGRDGFPEPVNTDRIMIGNDLHSDLVMDLAPEILYDPRHNNAFWPKIEITKALMDSGIVDFLNDSLYSDYTNYNDRLRHITLRLKARLQCIASAFKSVKSDLRVGAFTCGFWFHGVGAHSYLGAAALAADSIDYHGTHLYSAGGHNDESKDKRLNYSDICGVFMGDTADDGSSNTNHYLLNETLGDMHIHNYIKYHIVKDVPKYISLAGSIFGFTPSIKPLEITETNMSHHYEYEKNWDPQISVFNAIKLLEHKRAFYWLSGQSDYNLEVVQSYKMACAASNWPFIWGYDSVGQRLFREDSISNQNFDGGNLWSPECGYGIHATYLASCFLNDIGYRAIRYDSLALETAENISWCASGSFPARDWSVWTAEDILDPEQTLCPEFIEVVDPSFTKITIDPYIDPKGAINMILVNRDTVGVCTLSVTLGNTILFDSLDVWRLGINDSIWKEACHYVYGDSGFLPLGFAHNGFGYNSSGVRLRFQPVYLDSCDTINAIDQTIETDSSTYFALELDPMSFARVRVVPKQDSVAIILHPGWNLVSIPMFTGDKMLKELFYENEDTTDMRDSFWIQTFNVFGASIIETVTTIMRYKPTLLTYSPSWLGFIRSSDCRDSTNIPGLGYWVYSDTIDLVWVKGVRCHGYGVNLIKDFTDVSSMVNMVGSIWDETSYIGNFQPDSILQDTLIAWYWSNETENYCDTSCIIPTWGYLVRANITGFVSFPISDTGCYTSETELVIGYKDLQNWLHSPPGYADTSSIACSISNDTIFVTNRGSQNPISGCMVFIETGDTTVIGYTDKQDGIFTDDLIDVNDSTYIFLYKPGYRKLLVYPYGAMDSDTFRSDIVIYGDITIGSNDTLVILPGTNIYAAYRSDMMQTWMAERIDIVVQGHIIAVGDSLAPITFTVDVPADSTPAPSDWKGILHHYSGSGEYEHCRFEYMRYFQGHQPGGDVTFKNCTFANTYAHAIAYGTSRPSYIDRPTLIIEDSRFDTIGVWNAIYLVGTSDSTRISNCVFDSVQTYVFDFRDSAIVTVESCTLNRCFSALTVSRNANAKFINCLLHTSKSSYGWNVFDEGSLYVENSVLSKSSTGTGPRIYNWGTATFRYCSITDFTSDGVYCNSANTDMGTEKDLGHNCIWSDHPSANRLYFATKTADEFSVFGNWIDTLIFGGHSASDVDTGSFFPPDSCDTSIAKIVIEPEEKNSILPDKFELGPARPNPFNSTVTFDYKVPYECDLEIAIYDIIGNKIRVLFDGARGSGIYTEIWDGKDRNDRTVASGTYLYRLKADDYEETRKMTFLK